MLREICMDIKENLFLKLLTLKGVLAWDCQELSVSGHQHRGIQCGEVTREMDSWQHH